jgi:putative ABC transport system ATP-binding protein
MPVISVRDLRKTYVVGDIQVHALRGVSVDVEPGEFVCVTGPSGSGKSTFMHILGCLDKPTSGVYRLDGKSVGQMTRDQLAQLRNKKLGFVFQTFNLLARTSALENVELPLLYNGATAKERHARARSRLEQVGLLGREHHHPNQLSGGQQQRVAIARALINDPPIILADEPTGNLDSKTSIEIMSIFQQLNRQNGITVILVTHEHDVAAYTSRMIHFRDGRIVKDEPVAAPRDAAAELAVHA